MAAAAVVLNGSGQQAELDERVERCALGLRECLQQVSPFLGAGPIRVSGSAPGEEHAFGFEHHAIKSLLELKLKLLSSPKNYTIEFVSSGAIFDSASMFAVSVDGEPLDDEAAAGKGVAFCLFPSLLESEWPLPGLEQDLSNELLRGDWVHQKQLFPIEGVPRLKGNIIAKAQVVVFE